MKCVNIIMINVQDEYRGLLSGILHGGAQKDDRTGTGTRSVFGRMLRHDMAAGFPLLTTKKIYFNHAVTELLWILQGRTDIAYLRDHGVTYWDPDYKRSGRTDGTLGPVYGKQLRDFNGVDQLEKILKQIKQEPTSRRIVASLWNPNDMDDMALTPCHYSSCFTVLNGKLHCSMTQRSCDLFLGVPFNIASYSLMTHIMANDLGLEPGTFTWFGHDCHLYETHLDAATTQIDRIPYAAPTIALPPRRSIFDITIDEIKLQNYRCHPKIDAPMSV